MATNVSLIEGQKAPAPAHGSPLSQIAAGFGEVFRGLRESVADRSIMSIFLSFSLAVGGFVAFYLGWRGAAGTLVVGVQISYLASSGLAGFALLGLGLGIFHLQASRRLGAREDREWLTVLDRALAILQAARRG